MGPIGFVCKLCKKRGTNKGSSMLMHPDYELAIRVHTPCKIEYLAAGGTERPYKNEKSKWRVTAKTLAGKSAKKEKRNDVESVA